MTAPDPTAIRAHLASARREVESLLALLDVAAPPVAPASVQTGWPFDDGQRWAEWSAAPLTIRTDGELVYLVDRSSWDMAAMAPDDARRLAMALLAAAGWGADELAQRRQR